MKNPMNTVTSSPIAAAPVSTSSISTIGKEIVTMENSSRILNRSAERRCCLANLRNAVIAAAPAYAAALLNGAALPSFEEVEKAAAAYAAALTCTKNGKKVEYTSLPAALLVPASVTLVPKGAGDKKHFVWDVKGVSFFKNAFTVDSFERSEKCTPSTFEATEKDYLKEKTSSPKAKKPEWKVVYAGYTVEQKVAYQEYKAEKAIAKIRFEAAAPADKKFEFVDFDTWYANRPAA